MPASLAAVQIVVPSATVSSRPSIFSVTVRVSPGAWMVVATVVTSSYSVNKYVQPEVVQLIRGRHPVGGQSSGRVVPRDHAGKPLCGEPRRPAGGELERLGQEALGPRVVGGPPAPPPG